MAGPQTSSDRGKGCGCLLVLALALVASNLGTLGALSYFVVKDVRSPTGGDGGGEQHWGVEPSRVTYAPNLSTSHLKRYITSHNGTAMDGAATISFATLVMPTSGTVDRRSLQADGSEAAQAAHSHELHVELLRRTALGHFLTKRSMPAQSGRRLSEGAVRLRIRDTASKAESVIIPMEFDAQQLVYSDSDDVLRSNFSGVNPRIIFFAHKRHARDPHARAVHTFVSLPDDHRVMPTFHAGVGEREWREHVMPFYHAYWRAWVHSTVAAYPLQDEIVAHLTEQAKAVGRTLGGTRHGTSAGARSRQLSSSGAEGVQKDAKDFAIESVAEKVGAHALDGKGGSVVGTVAGVILDRHEWGACRPLHRRASLFLAPLQRSAQRPARLR